MTGVLESYPPSILKIHHKQVWIDYDEEADTLYLSLRKPQQATDSEMEGHVIYHYDGKELVGLTVLHAKEEAGSV